jgi:hypothetical protein
VRDAGNETSVSSEGENGNLGRLELFEFQPRCGNVSRRERESPTSAWSESERRTGR